VREHLDELREDKTRPVLEALARQGHSHFEVPYELMGTSGAEGQVEVGWRAERVAIYYDDERQAAHRLEEKGWKIFKAEASLSVEELAAALKGGT
jgi:hypothetical protein